MTQNKLKDKIKAQELEIKSLESTIKTLEAKAALKRLKNK